jgi:hypothetical protein
VRNRARSTRNRSVINLPHAQLMTRSGGDFIDCAAGFAQLMRNQKSANCAVGYRNPRVHYDGLLAALTRRPEAVFRVTGSS